MGTRNDIDSQLRNNDVSIQADNYIYMFMFCIKKMEQVNAQYRVYLYRVYLFGLYFDVHYRKEERLNPYR